MARDSGFAWLVGRWWFWTALVSLLFAQPLVRVFLRDPPVLPKVIAAVPEFGARQELDGKVWLASDPANTAELLRLHRRLRKLGDSFRIVVLPLDGNFTPPERVNPRVWKPLAAADAQTLARFFQLPVGEIALVDQTGQLRGRYPVGSKSDDDSLVTDVGLLVNNY
jgi:hypothetical protein